jgi:hypothetical protein
MAKYVVRFAPGTQPSDANANGELTIEAAGFKSDAGFIDFYSESTRNTHGTFNLKGRIVHRIKESAVLEIREARPS